MEKAAREVAILGAFITCMYFGFTYNSGWAFVGAVIAFLYIGNKDKD